MNVFFYVPTNNFLNLFTGIWIKNHFPLKSPLSELSSHADTLISWITENKDMSSANNLTLDDKLSDKSLL